MNDYFKKLNYAKSESEIDEILDDIIPILKERNVSISEIIAYFNMSTADNDFGPITQDHRLTNSNAKKAQIIIQKLREKLKK